MSPDDVQQIISVLIAVLAHNKKGIDGITAQSQATLQQAIDYINSETTKLRTDTTAAHGKLTQNVDAKLNGFMAQLQTLLNEAKALKPKDGKDVNPADIVPMVMKQLKLPENKPFTFTADDLMALLDQLPAEYQIDASRIKNLPGNKGLFHFGGSGRMKVYYYDLTAQCDGNTKVFNVPLNFGILGLFSTQAPIIYRPQIDWTEGNRTLTLTSQVDAPQAGQTLWCQYIR